MSYSDLIISFRKYRRLETLEFAIERKLQQSKDIQHELSLIAAADHRRAEIAAKRYFDAGKIPAYIWGLL